MRLKEVDEFYKFKYMYLTPYYIYYLILKQFSLLWC